MANVLLSPIDVDGTVKCLVCELTSEPAWLAVSGGQATAALKTDINSTGNTNGAIGSGCSTHSTSWFLLPGSAFEGEWGQLSFGITCLDTVTIRIHGANRGAISETSYEVYLDGVSVGSGTVPEDAAGVEIEIDLPAHTPCGSVVTAEVEVVGYGNLDPICLEITEVTS